MGSIRCVAVLVLGLGGCAGGTGAAYDDALARTKARVEAYEAAVGEAASFEACASERDRYLTEMGPLMDLMRQQGGELQACMGGMMGGGLHGDGMMGSEEGCRQLDDELSGYADVGCASSDAEVNRAEGLAHCARMQESLDQMGPRDCER